MYDNICEWNRRFKWTDNRCTKPCTIQIKSQTAICKVFPTLVMTLKRYVRRGTWRRRFIKMLGGCIFRRIQIFLTKLYLDDTCKFTFIFFYQIWSLLLHFIFRFFFQNLLVKSDKIRGLFTILKKATLKCLQSRHMKCYSKDFYKALFLQI